MYDEIIEKQELKIKNFPAKVLINNTWGGVVMSDAGESVYKFLTGHSYDEYEDGRDDPALITIYEQLGEEGFQKHCCKPSVITIEEATEVWIESQDGWDTLYWETADGEICSSNE